MKAKFLLIPLIAIGIILVVFNGWVNSTFGGFGYLQLADIAIWSFYIHLMILIVSVFALIFIVLVASSINRMRDPVPQRIPQRVMRTRYVEEEPEEDPEPEEPRKKRKYERSGKYAKKKPEPEPEPEPKPRGEKSHIYDKHKHNVKDKVKIEPGALCPICNQHPLSEAADGLACPNCGVIREEDYAE